MKQKFCGCFRTFSVVVCMYAAATLHTLFDIASFSSAFTLFPMLGPRERDGVGFTHLGIYPLCLLQEESIPNWVRTKQDLSRAEILYNIWGTTWNSCLICPYKDLFSHPLVVYAMHVWKLKEFSLQTILQSLLLLHGMIYLDLVSGFSAHGFFLAVKLLTVRAPTGA